MTYYVWVLCVVFSNWITVCILKNDAVLRKLFSELRLRRDLFRKSESFFRKSEGFFWESGGFFRRHERLLLKRRKASSTDVEGSEFRSICVASYMCWFSWDRLTMAILSKYVKEGIVSLKESGLTNHEVVETLKREGATMVRVTLSWYWQRWQAKRIWKADLCTVALLKTIKEIMQAYDEATAVQIRSLLRHDHRLLSLSTILRGRHELGWTYRTANWFAKQTKRNGSNGLVLIFTTTLRMLCGQIKWPYS